MRRLRSSAISLLLSGLALGALSCSASGPSRESGSARPFEDAAIEDSGKRLPGEFDLISLEDPYRQNNLQAPTAIKLGDNGEFKREDGSRIDEGTYLITPQSELVIYIEKVNGDLRSAARVERFQITDQSDNGFTLQEGPSGKLVFRKR